MGQQCAICHKKPVVGNTYTKRGKAKYLGGNGVKVTGKNKRVFNPNLQRLQVMLDGAVTTIRVCVKCIRSGLVVRPVKCKPFQVQSA